MNIFGFIGILIAIVVGVSLVPVIINSVNVLTETSEVSPAILSIVQFIPIIFIAILILGAVVCLSGFSIGGTDEVPKKTKNSKDLIKRLKKQSSNFGEYINNLDAILGLVTINKVEVDKPLYLGTNRELYISQDFDWYIVDKHPEKLFFKIVGLHKNDANKNVVYLLGKNKKNNSPYLVEVSIGDMENHYFDLAKIGEKDSNIQSLVNSNLIPSHKISEIVDSSTISVITKTLPVIFVAVLILGAATYISQI